MVQAVIDLVGAPSTTSLAFDTLIKGGKLVIVGLFGGAAPWPIAFIPMKALQILGSYTGSLAEMHDLMKLVREGKVKPVPVHKHPLAEANDVLMSLHDGKNILPLRHH